MSAGLLSGDKLELLQELAFEPDEDEAEWLRWFMDLARCGTRIRGQGLSLRSNERVRCAVTSAREDVHVIQTCC
jgi:hypothetical protein